MKQKIDVCCVTKGYPSKAWLKNLERLPVNNLIVENSVPLVQARAKAIEKVETEWFMWLDDDVYLCPDWWSKASALIADDVGAVQGREQIYGMGKKVEPEINRYRRRFPTKELKLGQRGTTVDTLMRTSLVKDWKPTVLVFFFDHFVFSKS